jgi:hypothetical protein
MGKKGRLRSEWAANKARATTSPSCGRMRRKATDDELFLGRNNPTRWVPWSLGGRADNNRRFRNYRYKPKCRGDAWTVGQLKMREKFGFESRLLP